MEQLSETSSFESSSGEESVLPPAANMSSFSLGSNIFITITGTVVLGIGSKMQQGGWIITPALLVLGTIVMSEMMWLVSTTIDKAMDMDPSLEAPTSYKDYAALALGRPGELVTSLTSTFSLFSMICGGLIVLAQNLEAIFPIPDTLPGMPGAGQKWWAFFLTFETLIFVFVDIGDLLEKSALAGPLVTAGAFLMVFWGCLRAWRASEEFPEECHPADSYYSTWPPIENGIFGFALILAQLASYSVFVFAVVVTVPTLKSQTAKPRRLVPASVVAFAIATALFLALMLAYYASFGNLGPENVIQGMHSHRPEGWWATEQPWRTGSETNLGKALAALVSLHVCLGDVIYVGCTVVAFEALVPRRMRGRKRAKLLVRLGVAAGRTLVATVVTSFTTLSSLTGSLFVVFNNILVPIAGFYAVHGFASVGPVRKAAHACIFAFGIYMVVVGTWGSIQSLVTSAETGVRIGAFPRAGISAECQAAYARAVGNNMTTSISPAVQ